MSIKMLSGINTMMWHTQNILHKKPQVVPGTLLSLAGCLIVYHHMQPSIDEHGDALKTFLAMILLQMLPLVILEMKIMSCADPVGLFCKFATPVTLIHAFFLGMRLVMYEHDDSTTLYISAIGFVAALLTMVIFRQSLMGIIECYNVWSLIILALAAAIATTALDDYMNPRPVYWKRQPWHAYVAEVLQTSNSYIEIIAFVPAVWMVFREKQNETRYQVESTDTKRVSTAFFLFLVGFYIMEDLGNAYISYQLSGLATIAHICHFALLVDFACYVLAHIYNPDKLVGELRRWLPIDFSHEV